MLPAVEAGEASTATALGARVDVVASAVKTEPEAVLPGVEVHLKLLTLELKSSA